MAPEYKDLIIKSIYMQWKTWLERFPDEEGLDDPKYMDAEIERWAPEWMSFIKKSFDKNLYIKANSFIKPIKPYSNVKGRCYYNALDYVLNHKQDHKDLELCIGFLFEVKIFDLLKKGLQDNKMYSNGTYDVTKHVFCKVGNKILDPTMGSAFIGDIYCYRIVPEETYKNFYHKPNDEEQDARHVEDYFDNILNKEKNYVNWLDEFILYIKKIRG
jgi:hypothetical protein